jgi:hypothetical protein
MTVLASLEVNIVWFYSILGIHHIGTNSVTISVCEALDGSFRAAQNR